MPIRLTGMNSGLDTEALVSELVSAYRKKTDKYVKAQAKVSWKQDAWKTMSAKTFSFRNKLDSLRFSSSYKLKTTSVSNTTKATITAGNDAVNGTQTLNITALAKSGYLTGGRLHRDDGKTAAGDTTLASMGFNGDGKVSLNGKEITLSGSMTINDAVNAFKDAGVNANFDATNQRIFVSSTESGKANDFSLSALDANGAQALKSMGLYVRSATTDDLYKAYDEKYGSKSASDLEALLQQYNSNAALVKDAVDTASYLARALEYANAKKTVEDTDAKLTGGNQVLAENLLANKDKLVYGSQTFTYHKGEDGEVYYTDDSETPADGAEKTKYYLTTVTKDGTETEKDKDGNDVLDESGNPVMKKVTERYLSTSKVLDDTVPGAMASAKKVETADDYLKANFVLTGEEISAYRSAKSTIENMEAAVQAELAAKAEAEQKATEAGETYIDPSTQGNYTEYRSLASVMSLVDSGMTADEIKAEQSRIASEKTTAQDAIDADSLLASYAKDYAAATDDETKKGVVDKLEKHIDYAVAARTKTDEEMGYASDAVRVDGQDAVIYLNGAQFTSNSNTFSINGLTINALATTTTEEKIKAGQADDDALTVTTTTDNQGIYDKIKDFLSEYNSLINSMTASYNAANVSQYEPLTDEEKEAMTDSQIEKWEEKGKSGVLRRDTTLSALMSAMTNAMAKSYTVNGKNYSLASFGIKTLGILNAEKFEQNAYHIDGDADDDSVSGNADKLMAAIVEDPDAVMGFFQKLSSELYDNLGKKMSSTSMRTYGTFYNDKEMAKEYSDYTTTISKWEQKVADIEDSYYKKFAAMESALAKLQSQTSQLSGLLGS